MKTGGYNPLSLGLIGQGLGLC